MATLSCGEESAWAVWALKPGVPTCLVSPPSLKTTTRSDEHHGARAVPQTDMEAQQGPTKVGLHPLKRELYQALPWLLGG